MKQHTHITKKIKNGKGCVAWNYYYYIIYEQLVNFICKYSSYTHTAIKIKSIARERRKINSKESKYNNNSVNLSRFCLRIFSFSL